jgi:hypothetical protein
MRLPRVFVMTNKEIVECHSALGFFAEFILSEANVLQNDIGKKGNGLAMTACIRLQ